MSRRRRGSVRGLGPKSAVVWTASHERMADARVTAMGRWSDFTRLEAICKGLGRRHYRRYLPEEC